MTVYAPPKAIRVKTSAGWMDMLIQGAPGQGVPLGGAPGQSLIKNSGSDYDTVWGAAAGGGVDYIGNWAAGTAFKRGDVVRYQGNDYMAVNDSTGVVPPAPATPANGVPVPVVNGQWVKGVGGVPVWAAIVAADLPPQAVATYGITPPASPADGAEHVLVDSLTNPSYQWRFRFNAGSSSAYKWEFIGGAPARATSQAAVSNGATLNAWMNMGSTTLTVPRSGDYYISGWCTCSHPTAGATIYAGLYVGAVSNVPTYSNFGFPVAGGYSGSIAISSFRTTPSAGQVVGICGQSNYASGSWQFMAWELLPVRVA